MDNYPDGTRVELTATPASGWNFTGWSGDASGSANPLTVTMNSNKTITANFSTPDPTAEISGSATICAGNPADLTIFLTGVGPWQVTYSDGEDNFMRNINESPYTFSVFTNDSRTYTIVNVRDASGREGETYGSAVINIIPTVVIGRWYEETFDDAPSLWVSSVSVGSDSWTYGLPEGNIFTSASSGGKIWYTDIDDPASPERSAVTSPCFDLTQSVRPMIAIDLWKEFGQNNDGAVLQYSLNNDNDWQNVGTIGTGLNWYNSLQVEGRPGGQRTGWTGTGEGWTESRHDLDMAAGRDQVRLRIAYGNDGTGQTNGGLAFDNIRIGERTKTILVEHFTNMLDESSLQANRDLHATAVSTPHDVAYISYHTAFPPGDPLNSQNPADPAARALYYGISTVPYSVLDGAPGGGGEFDYSSSAPESSEILRNALTEPVFTIELRQNVADNIMNIEAIVNSLSTVDNSDLTLHIVVIETEVITSSPGSENSITFRNVVRKLMPDAGGTALPATWAAGQSRDYTFNWDIENIIDNENLALVAFVQDVNTREVFQTGISAQFEIPTFTRERITGPGNQQPEVIFYPNPATDRIFIRFREYLAEDHILEVYNISGNLVSTNLLRAGSNDYEFNAGNLSGVFILRVRKNDSIIGTARVIIH
jgi:hypothetical protein